MRPHASIITPVEALAGLRSQREEVVARGFLRSRHVLSLDSRIATDAGSLLRNYVRSHRIDIADAVTAATAAHQDWVWRRST